MTITNLLPAILVAGPPHSGKSVLAYLLSQRLREAQVSHILLRAAPDGEGDWSYESADEACVRQRQKGVYTADLIEDLLHAIHNRSLPMLVDIGGRPHDAQFRLFDACTHVIHLWREANDRHEWETWLEERSLIPIASLHTQLAPPDRLEPGAGPLRGVIAGLDRANPQAGLMFERVLERVLGICSYPPDALEAEHLRRAPHDVPLLTVAQLARDLGIMRPGQELWWAPEHLAGLRDLVPSGEPLALYGRGPVWLYAALAAHVAPAPFYVFDARYYGWMAPPPVILDSDRANAEFALLTLPEGQDIRLKFERQQAHYVLKPLPVHVPSLPLDRRVILDGPMPIWLFAALARGLRRQTALATYEPRSSRIITFWTKMASP
jgi:CRISPR-associated protein Csx3